MVTIKDDIKNKRQKYSKLVLQRKTEKSKKKEKRKKKKKERDKPIKEKNWHRGKKS